MVQKSYLWLCRGSEKDACLVPGRLGDRGEHEPSPYRARTLLAPLALDADLMLKQKQKEKYILFNIKC